MPELNVIGPESTISTVVFGTPGRLGSPTPDPSASKPGSPGSSSLIPNYYGIAHESLPNYVALIGGQSPTPQTPQDCNPYSDVTPGSSAANGQVTGSGCVYPASRLTLADQLMQRGSAAPGLVDSTSPPPSASPVPAPSAGRSAAVVRTVPERLVAIPWRAAGKRRVRWRVAVGYVDSIPGRTAVDPPVAPHRVDAGRAASYRRRRSPPSTAVDGETATSAVRPPSLISMATSVFDLYTIGIGPSSSHTVGPMRAARVFARRLQETGLLERTDAVRVELLGSLGATGRGHGTDRAVLMGLEGETPEDVDPRSIEARVRKIRAGRELCVLGARRIAFDEAHDLLFRPDERMATHPNGMRFTALDVAGEALRTDIFFSVGGGFVVDASTEREGEQGDDSHVPHPFSTGEELLAQCRSAGLAVSGVMLANERTWRDEEQIRRGLLRVSAAMRACIEAGCSTDGILPGGLGVRRRAPDLLLRLTAGDGDRDPLGVLNWVTLSALAVNEENAAGGRVVTAPTNGAAGIVPAVLEYFLRFIDGAGDDGVVRFLLSAGAIAIICKRTASISGSEVGCQGEVGSACAMAAAGLAEVLGGTPEQVENAAEIGIEHNLGLTCDPVGGLVQVPCIERNAIAAAKAIAAAQLALQGDGSHRVSLDIALRTLRDTGADMRDKYKETARGGLAVNVVEC